jgi:hypothetical protein
MLFLACIFSHAQDFALQKPFSAITEAGQCKLLLYARKYEELILFCIVGSDFSYRGTGIATSAYHEARQ